MNKDNIIYWTATGIIALMMGFSGVAYFTVPNMPAEFAKTGFPDFFRVELGIAKIIGVLALVLPMIPIKIKDAAYAGFGIVLVSASVAHAGIGDEVAKIVTSLVILGILAVPYIYLHKKTTV